MAGDSASASRIKMAGDFTSAGARAFRPLLIINFISRVPKIQALNLAAVNED